MSRHFHLIAAIAIGIGLTLSPAQAFNPQPDPPARTRVDVDKSRITAPGIIAPGNSDSSASGPASTGTPLGAAAGTSGAKAGAAGIR